MSGKTTENSRSPGDFGDPAPNPEALARGKRLEEAVKDAGGRAKVRRLSGVAESTILGYEKGGEIKLGNAIALSDATGVRLEWLATGRGAKREGEAAPRAKPGPLRLFGSVDLDQLATALRAAKAAAGDDERLLLHSLVLIYDAISERKEATSSSPTTSLE